MSVLALVMDSSFNPAGSPEPLRILLFSSASVAMAPANTDSLEPRKKFKLLTFKIPEKNHCFSLDCPHMYKKIPL